MLWNFALGFLSLISLARRSESVSPTLPLVRKIDVADCPSLGAAEGTKFYNEACSNDTDCFGATDSVQCVGKVCRCKENYYPEARFTGENAIQTVCVIAPALFSQCRGVCQKPAQCVPYTGDDVKGRNVSVCLCQSPFVLQDGQCFLKCPTDSYYYSDKGLCMPTCKAAEVKTNDGVCLPLSDLNSNCKTQEQCQAVNSYCKSGLCTCRDGFVSQKGTCVPQVVNCPFGDALKAKDGSFQQCVISFGDPTTTNSTTMKQGSSSNPERPFWGQKATPKDNCPKDYSCIVSQPDVQSGNKTGYCCPSVNVDCPTGVPHPNATCSIDTPPSDGGYCPWLTHYCHSFGFGGFAPQMLCCPKDCPTSMVNVNGKCMPSLKVGDKCQDSKQCDTQFAGCIEGTCKCEPGSKAKGNYPFIFCSKECQQDEILNGDQCEKRLRLGDVCSQSTSQKCPDYAYCNKNKRCACQCGTFTLADDVCAPAPVCRRMVIIADKVADVQASLTISDVEKAKLLQNVTFCAVKDAQVPAGVQASKCKQNEYCSSYISNLGLCCPKPKWCCFPEPTCFGGSAPLTDKQCDVSDQLSCGLNSICMKYLFPVDQDDKSKDYTMCCPSLQDG